MNAKQPLWERDPEAYQARLREGNAHLPRKLVSADALITDTTGRILLVDPSYKDLWDIPGGVAEANEAPDETVRRELREELGLDLAGPLPMLCVDWVPPHGAWDDWMKFIFDGGTLTSDQIAQLEITDTELNGFAFYTPNQARKRLREDVWDRTDAALRARTSGHAAYLHRGHRLR